MRMLAHGSNAPVEPVEAVGLDGDMLEAQAFAYLAVRVRRGLPTSAPATTGVRLPVSGGRHQPPLRRAGGGRVVLAYSAATRRSARIGAR